MNNATKTLGKKSVLKHIIASLSCLTIASLSCSNLLAAELELKVIVKNHVFTQPVIKVPANQKVKVTFENQDASIEEFDSRDLKVEKVVMPNSKGEFFIGPLKKGTYKFRGEFHEATAHGVVVAE
jgi:heme/copper-type cytochrome/quinol oxidase subunit 2